jgi:trimeric autotransporter adhesin
MKKNTQFTQIYLSLGLFLMCLLGMAQSPQTFTSTSTFTVPAGVTSVTVEAWGGGGAGGSRSGLAGSSGGGGGGAYAQSTIAVTPGSTYTVTVGTGSTSASAGGDSWFINNTTLLAKGGNSVPNNSSTGATGGASGACIGTFVFSGGDGSNGVSGTGGGGGGSSAGTAANGATAVNSTAGATAPSGGGNGGNGKTGGGGAGGAGSLSGGGGGGAYTTGNGNQSVGPGANGKVIISWTAPATYCTPTFTDGVEPITNVTFAGINRTTSNALGGSSLESFTDTATVTQGSATNAISVKGNTSGNYTDNFRVYIDWDQNGTYGNNANEIYDIGTLTNSTGIDAKVVIGNIIVPITALLGTTAMRVMKRYNGYPTGPCQTGSGWGQTEDYVVNVIASVPPTIASLGASSGCVGSSININGTNLTGATASTVTIGGTPVSSITSNSGTVLVAVLGSGTTGTVSVTTPGGTATSGSTFAVNAVPAQPSTISGNTTACAGTSQIYSVTNVPGTTYTWSFPAGWTQTAGGTTNSITVTTNGTSGTISVTPSNSCGNGTTRTLSVTIGPIANAGTALTTICQGATTAALGGSFGGGATSATWSTTSGGSFANNGGTTPNTTTWTPPPGFTGTATLVLTTAGGSCGSTTASKTQVVSNGAFATVGSAMTIIGSLTSTSLGGNNPSPGTGIWTKVSGPSGTTTFSNSSSENSTATVLAVGTYVFRWTVTSSCGTSSADITVTFLDAFSSRNYTLFYEDFDATNGGWTNSTSTNGSWLWTNAFPVTISEIGENSFWRLNDFDDYKNNSVVEIDSPIYNLSGYQNLLFNIDIRYNTEKDKDGMRILYSINGGAFVQLGSNGTGINWYNSSSVTALSSNGWTDNSATSSLAFTPVGIGANRFVRATTTLDDGIFKNQSNVRFRIQFKSDNNNIANGVAFDNLSIEGDPIIALVPPPIAPAKINQNLSLWFKSNAGISATDGTALTMWEDQAYDTSRADLVDKESAKALVTDAPTFRDNSTRNINFNPVVDFNAANKQYMNAKGGLYSQDYFVVVYSDDLVQNVTGASGRQIPLGGKSDERTFHEDPTGLGLGNTTARYSPSEVIAHNVGAYAPGSGSPAAGVDSYGRAFTSTAVTYNEPLIINVKTNAEGTQTEIYKNGIKIDNTTGKTGDTGTGNTLNFYQFRNLPLYLGTGRSGISGRAYSALNGRLSEVVAYKAPNSAIDQQKIQSYLGIKYGITLHSIGSANDSGVSLSTRLNDVDYFDSAGNIIWNTIANSSYNYDIAGIGRDDDSQLYQKQSKTVNTNDDITIGLSTIAATNNLNNNTCNNKHFLVWGNNQGSLAAQPEVKVNMSAGITPSLTSEVTFISVGRTWKVVETGGNVPTTKVSIPISMLSLLPPPPGDYLMFISNTTNFDPTAEYRIMSLNGSNLETTYDFDGTKYITFGFAPEKKYERSIAFDGNNDYLDAGKVLNLNTSFTVSSWIKRNGSNQTILSKRNNTFTIGYDLSINSGGRAEMSWINGAKQTITSSVVIPAGIWHNVAVSFDGATAKLYIDGVLDITKSMSTVPTNTHSFLIAAADGVSPTSFFNGNIDEVRVWNVALTDKQLRYVMNQEILRNGLATNGRIIPNTITLNEISPIPWTNLSAYYPMSTYTYTNAKDVSANNYTAALRNLTTVDLQTAPLPYESITDGPWSTAATWKNNTVQDLPNSLSIKAGAGAVDWNIVKTNHNISSTGHKTVLGLMIEGNTITASNDSKIEVTNYLKLDGKIDLVGMSQLVQTLDCDLDVTSSGSIERDQQGQANTYNYNYWSSPVSPINSTANNTNYTVKGMMKDGFNAIPREINWIGGYNGLAGNGTTAMSIARYWLYTFDYKTNAYANWNKISETTAIPVGLGFTMKGSGGSGTQNYTFVGKPNNGLINTNTVASDQLLLTGNPYPSALDADAFINNNSGSIDGTLYFWEHYSTNNTHVLKDYQGGYATYNLVGGTGVATSADLDPTISSSGSQSKGVPKRYIPVGQGFFVNGSTAGGIVTFNNQRAFFKETDATNSNVLYKKRPSSSKVAAIDHWNNNSNDTPQKDTFKRVRLGFNSNNNYHRQVLLGFMNEKATSQMDYGYDAISLDEIPNDMYFLNGENQLVIQGEGYFNEDASFPIGIKTNVEGKVSLIIDALENFEPEQKVYIYDDENKTYNEIQKNAFEVNLPAGVNNTRFSLRFKDKSLTTEKTLSVDENNAKSNEIIIAHIQDSNTLKISNNSAETTVEKVTLLNINGQVIANWKIENQDQQNIQIPIKTVTRGVYIAKLSTTTGELSKKLIIK